MFEISYNEYSIISNALSRLCRKNFDDYGIDIYIQNGAFSNSKVITATINWASIGSVSPDVADKFAEDLNLAIEITKTINMMQFIIFDWSNEYSEHEKALYNRIDDIVSALEDRDEFELESIIDDTRDEYGY